jgi:hypothetical protein
MSKLHHARIKSLTWGLALALASLSAQAALQTITTGSTPVSLNGQPTLDYQFGSDLVRFVNATAVNVSSPDLAIKTVMRVRPVTLGPSLTQLTASGMGITSLTLDTADGSVHGVQLGGNLTLTQAADDFLSSGGVVNFSNLRVDLDTRNVYGNVTGGNGLNTISNLRLFNISTQSASFTSQTVPLVAGGVTPLPGEGGYYYGGYYYGGTFNPGNPPTTPGALTTIGNLNLQFNDLLLTPEALAPLVQALGYTTAGAAALQSVTNWGSLGTPSVPEPGTWALMGLGLVGISAAARRRQTANAA